MSEFKENAIVHGTSPRKLQEMTLNSLEALEGTIVSGVSMKQYEEQLNVLKKENFHLKLRIYFLEEKLGTGAPPAAQGLLEHNVRLQVESEELRRQLSDKQELLAVAAEAIDVLEQQGSISNDSVEASIDNSTSHLKIGGGIPIEQTFTVDQTCDETCPESESGPGDYLTSTINIDDKNEVERLRSEHHKALAVIKGCVKKIQQQNKEIKVLKMNKEMNSAHIGDNQVEKYEEIVKCKDEHIKQLESKVKDLQSVIDTDQMDNNGNLQQLLTRRLQGLAYFLDKLLSHKCVLGEDKKKLAESILEQSLALPVGLKLDESMAIEDLTMDESAIDMSQSLRIEDLTMMFGHHMGCGSRSARRASRRVLMSDSECWSEPDRNVSQARIGLADTPAASAAVAAGSPPRQQRPRRSRASRSEDNAALLDELDTLAAQLQRHEAEKSDLEERLEVARGEVERLEGERERLDELLRTEGTRAAEASERAARLEGELKAAEERARSAADAAERARAQWREMEQGYGEREAALRRAADEAAVAASAAALERARDQRERLRAERERDDAIAMLHAASAPAPVSLPPPASPPPRATSPDQGIDSDRLSSLENNELSLSPRSLYEENVVLKKKLARSKATLAEALVQLNAANVMKMGVQRAICREIHKTQGVLRKARDQFDNPK